MDFDARNNILRLSLEGRVTDAILLESYATSARYAASHPPCRGIADFSEVTEFEVSSTAIKQLAQSSPAIPTGYLRVCVAPLDFIFGMVRMFQILGEGTRPDLRVVRTMDEPHHLLGVESPEFNPLN
jgi:hypothetical protein